jgi:hypothetical protein
MRHAVLTAALAALVAVPATSGDRLLAQGESDRQDALRQQVEQHFQVLPVQGSWILRPKSGEGGVRSIQIIDGSIVVDGMPATGAELRDKLGTDADVVLRLSYLDADARQQLLSRAAEAPADQSLDRPAERERSDERPGFGNGRRPGRRARVDGNDRVRFGGDVVVGEGEVVNGDVVSIGGATRVDGEVNGDAVAIGGGLELGPHATVRGDAVSIVGPLKRAPGARVEGKVVDVGAGTPVRFGPGEWRNFLRPRFFPFGAMFLGAAAGVLALMGTVMRVVVLCLLSSIMLFVGREYVERVGARAAAEPLKAGIIGFLAQLLFGPLLILTMLVFIITIVGIPLLLLVPFALLAFGVILLLGFTAVAYKVGLFANARLAWHHDNPYLTAITGIVLLVSPLLIARVVGLGDRLFFPLTGTLVFLGVVSEYVAWTVGFGAVALLRFERSPASQPPVSA